MIAAGVAAARLKFVRPRANQAFPRTAHDWVPGGDEITPTMKLKRRPIAQVRRGDRGVVRQRTRPGHPRNRTRIVNSAREGRARADASFRSRSAVTNPRRRTSSVSRGTSDPFVTFWNLFLRGRFRCVVAGSGKPPIRQRQLGDRPHGEQVLTQHRTSRVRQFIGGAQSTHPLGDLRIPIVRQIRVEVVFDLVAQVSGHEPQRWSGVEIRGAQHLPEIPFPLRLILQH